MPLNQRIPSLDSLSSSSSASLPAGLGLNIGLDTGLGQDVRLLMLFDPFLPPGSIRQNHLEKKEREKNVSCTLNVIILCRCWGKTHLFFKQWQEETGCCLQNS